MENQTNYQENSFNQNFNNNPQVPLPNASTILVLGIVSIVGCCCSYGVIGIVCSIIALVMAKTAESVYRSNPAAYTESSYKNMNTGKICAIISLVLSIVSIIMMIITIGIYGWAVLADPQSIMNLYNQ